MMSDSEIRRRLSGFEDVWRRVSARTPLPAPLPVKLMPRRKEACKSSGCPPCRDRGCGPCR